MQIKCYNKQRVELKFFTLLRFVKYVIFRRIEERVTALILEKLWQNHPFIVEVQEESACGIKGYIPDGTTELFSLVEFYIRSFKEYLKPSKD